MIKVKIKNSHPILSAWIVICGLLYIFASQFQYPFMPVLFLYGMVFGLVVMTLFEDRIILSNHMAIFGLVVVSSFIGLIYTTMKEDGLREAILFTFFLGMFALSLINPAFIRIFTKWIYICSVVLVISTLIHFLSADWFNSWIKQVLRPNIYEELMWSYNVDHTYAGLAGLTPNTTFSAAIVFGYSFLHLIKKEEMPIIKNRGQNIIFLILSLFAIVICSKRGIFVAVIIALLVVLFYIYRGKHFFVRFVSVAVVAAIIMIILYFTSDFVSAFFNRFTGDDITTGRDDIYRDVWNDFVKSNILIGRGTGATYKVADTGAHNIYLQILYDHGVILSVPYYIFLIYNYALAFKNQCPLSIFVQTMFLVYGLVGNPLYSNMFMMIYLYYVLYAARMPVFIKENKESQRIANGGNNGKSV